MAPLLRPWPLPADAPRLLAVMLGLGALGTVPRMFGPQTSLLGAVMTVGVMLLPVLAVGALCISQRQRWVRWGAGLAAGVAAAWSHYTLLDPAMNQDANIGLGLYFLGGFVLVLGPAALLGGGVGWLLGRWAAPHEGT